MFDIVNTGLTPGSVAISIAIAFGFYLLYRLFFGSMRYRAQQRTIEALSRRVLKLEADAAERHSQEHAVLELLGISMRSLVEGLSPSDKQNIRKVLSDAAAKIVSELEVPEDVLQELRQAALTEARSSIPTIVKSDSFGTEASRAVTEAAREYIETLMRSNGTTREMMEREVYTLIRQNVSPSVVASPSFGEYATQVVKEHALAYVNTLMVNGGTTREMLERLIYTRLRHETNGECVESPEFRVAARQLVVAAALSHANKIAPAIIGRALEDGGALHMKVKAALSEAARQAQ